MGQKAERSCCGFDKSLLKQIVWCVLEFSLEMLHPGSILSASDGFQRCRYCPFEPSSYNACVSVCLCQCLTFIILSYIFRHNECRCCTKRITEWFVECENDVNHMFPFTITLPLSDQLCANLGQKHQGIYCISFLQETICWGGSLNSTARIM